MESKQYTRQISVKVVKKLPSYRKLQRQSHPFNLTSCRWRRICKLNKESPEQTERTDGAKYGTIMEEKILESAKDMRLQLRFTFQQDNDPRREARATKQNLIMYPCGPVMVQT